MSQEITNFIMAKIYVEKAIKKKKTVQENFLRKGTPNNKFRLDTSNKELKRIIKVSEGI